MDQDVSVMRVTELPQGNKFSDLAHVWWPAYEKPIKAGPYYEGDSHKTG